MDINITTTWIIILVIAAIWELVWKGMALWRAGQHGHLAWFVVILIINSAGLLPIIYLLLHRQEAHKNQEVTVSHG